MASSASLRPMGSGLSYLIASAFLPPAQERTAASRSRPSIRRGVQLGVFERLFEFREREAQVPVQLGWQGVAACGTQEVLKRANRGRHARFVASWRVQGIPSRSRQAQELLVRDSPVKVIVHRVKQPPQGAAILLTHNTSVPHAEGPRAGTRQSRDVGL
jgi:hypothetical protein